MATFSDLPLEVKQMIFNRLSIPDLLQSCLVSYNWKTAIQAILPLRKVALLLRPETDFKAIKNSFIRYTALDIGVKEFIAPWKARMMYDLLAHLKRNNNLKQLYITVDSTEKLLEVVKATEDLFNKLEELHITFQPVDVSFLCSRQKFDLRLPELRRFSWNEPKRIEFFGTPPSIATQFVVFAPKLHSTNLQFRIRSNYWEYISGNWRENMSTPPLILRESNQLTELFIRLGDNLFGDIVDVTLQNLRWFELAEVNQTKTMTDFKWNETFHQTQQLEFIKLRRCHPDVFQAALKQCKKITSCEIITDSTYSDAMFENINVAWPFLEKSVIREEGQKDLWENDENAFSIPYLPDEYIDQFNLADIEAMADEDWENSEDEDYYDA